MTTDRSDLGDDAYVPAAEADSIAVVEGFFAHLAMHLRAEDLPDGLFEDMRGNIAELVAADAHRIVDEPARYNLHMTLALVVAYRALVPRLGRESALAAVRAAFVEPLSVAVGESTRAMLETGDPFATIVAASKAREKHSFGAGFTFVRTVDDERSYHVDVARCFYHDVLTAHSVPELTPVMCAFDTNWIVAMDPERHGFTFERATTLGLGGTHCPFHWDRIEG
ncbi:L-2-amino-thiazoline-4-carboxylic acid hydrolase [Nocardia brasiliensis]|uniref:L-2-amino-thiazoline-4-carboxylic acid hydrolase n=1 Tax=Nocardia brasiliensis TaxID=37326 RepID=UPI0033F94B93